MSNTTIEKNIVQLEFDAKKFQDGVSESADSLTKFKNKFDFKDAEAAFQNMEKVAAIDFTGMSNALEGINSKLSIMGVAAGVIVAKITEAALSGAKKLADTLVLSAVGDGFGEYETQLNAVQTILANTSKAGVNLADVTEALDELNEYADLTIYNFTEMTRNIGTFTAAGVDLGTSVAAIKGIANLAALSGSSSVQASTGMYQLSQAISSGTVRLMDWNSVQSAGMGGQVFKDALITTAKVHGASMADMKAAEDDFRGSLTTGWLSSEILLETLSQLTGDLTDEQLKSMGYTQDQIVEIQALAVVANDAATKVKTFTALKDVLQEALGSGWAVSFRWILGDFEQAKELWGGVAETLTTVIDESGDARNALLQGWSERGGRATAVQALMDALEGGLAVIYHVKDAIQDVFKPLEVADLLGITRKIGAMATRFRESTVGMDNFKNVVRGIASIFKIFFMIIGAVVKVFGLFFRGVTLVDGGIWALLGGIGAAIFAWQQWAEETKFFNRLAIIIAFRLDYLKNTIKDLVRQFLELKVVKDVVAWFRGLGKDDWLNVLAGAKAVLRAIIAPFYLLAVGAKLLYKEIVKLKVIQDIVAWFNNIDWAATAQYFKDLAGEAQEMFDTFKTETLPNFGVEIDEMIAKIKELWDEFSNSDVVESFLGLLDTFDGRRIKQLGADAKEGFSWIDSLKESKFGVWLEETLGKAGAKAKELGKGLLEGLTEVFNYFTENAGNLDYSTLFDIINTGLLGGMMLSIRSIASGDFISNIVDDSDFGEGIIDVFGQLEGTIGSFQNNIRADTLQKIAVSIALLAGSVLMLTLVDSTKLELATAAIVVMLATLFGASGALKLVKPKDAIQAAVVIVGIAIAVAILSGALFLLKDLDADQIQSGMEAIIVSLVALNTAVATLKTGKSSGKAVAVIMGIAIALAALWVPIKLFGTTDPAILTNGLIGVGLALAGLTASLAVLSKTGGDKNSSLKAAIAMLAIAKAMEKLWMSVVKFGVLDKDILSQGLKAIGIIMAGMAVFSRGIKTKQILEAGVAMLAMGVALNVVFIAVEAFGKMNFKELVVGMTAIIAIIALFAIAGFLMAGALPAAQAMVVMAAALILIAIALKILATIPVEKLMAGIIVIAVVLLIFIVAGYLLAPVVLVLVAFGIALMLIGIGAALFGLGIMLAALGLAALASAFVLVGSSLAVIGPAIVQWIPQMAIAIAEGITAFIVEIATKLPEIIEAGKEILLAIIEGFVSLFPDIVLMVGELIVELLEGLVALLPRIVQAGYDILIAIMKGVEDNIKEVVTTALSIIDQFIQGITDGLPDIVTSAVELYFTFLETIESEVITQDNIERLMAIGLSVAGNIIAGLVAGIGNGVQAVGSAIWNLVTGAKDQMEGPEGVDTGSPSKWSYGVGQNIIQGLVNALEQGILTTRSAIKEFTMNTKKEFSPLISLLSDELNDAIELRPLITPVMDLSEVTAGAGLIRSAFGSVAIPADLTAIGVGTGTVDVNATDSDDNENGVIYNQYNYSPKALDRAAIYRQTRTQVATLSRKVFEK